MGNRTDVLPHIMLTKGVERHQLMYHQYFLTAPYYTPLQSLGSISYYMYKGPDDDKPKAVYVNLKHNEMILPISEEYAKFLEELDLNNLIYVIGISVADSIYPMTKVNETIYIKRISKTYAGLYLVYTAHKKPSNKKKSYTKIGYYIDNIGFIKCTFNPEDRHIYSLYDVITDPDNQPYFLYTATDYIAELYVMSQCAKHNVKYEGFPKLANRLSYEYIFECRLEDKFFS